MQTLKSEVTVFVKLVGFPLATFQFDQRNVQLPFSHDSDSMDGNVGWLVDPPL